MGKTQNLCLFIFGQERLEEKLVALGFKVLSIQTNRFDKPSRKIYAKEDDYAGWLVEKTRVPAADPDSVPVPISRTIKRIERNLLSRYPEGASFAKIFIAAHGGDWGIASSLYKDAEKGEAFFPQDFKKSESALSGIIEESNKFAERLKKKYGANEVIIKVFSHVILSDINTKFEREPASFFSKEVQEDIFKPKETRKKIAGDPSENLFDSNLKQSPEQLKYLETLFFEFRMCLTALLASTGINGEDDLWKEIQEKMILLLKGGRLIRHWTEKLVCDASCKKPGRSLKEKSFTEECRVFGIGHFLSIYARDTELVVTCAGILEKEPLDATQLKEKSGNLIALVREVLETENK
jgi:hypothetical protein